MDVVSTTENHYGIMWEKLVIDDEHTSYFTGIPWCIEYVDNKNCWMLYKSLDVLFETSSIALALMVAREYIMEDNASRR